MRNIVDTTPGRGKLVDRKAEPAEIVNGFGAATLDVYLNEFAYWKNVPKPVWDFTVGGYQVIKKWLSYREHSILGRALTLDEIREVTSMARRIAALIILGPKLDENYHNVIAEPYAWS